MFAPATDLPTRRIGDGPGSLEVSVVGLGCSNFGGRLDRDRTRAVIDAALDAGSPCSTQPTSMADPAAASR